MKNGFLGGNFIMNSYIEVEGVAVNKNKIVKAEFNKNIQQDQYRVLITYINEKGEKVSGWIEIKTNVKPYRLHIFDDLIPKVLELFPKSNVVFTAEPFERYIEKLTKNE